MHVHPRHAEERDLRAYLKAGITTVRERRACAEGLLQAGYDWIKFCSFLPNEAFFGLVEESHRLGIRTGGHIPVDLTLLEVFDAGVDSIGSCRPRWSRSRGPIPSCERKVEGTCHRGPPP
ncbi:MAG: hypothetical protein GY711_11520 [bacterium]|nr:hypothetical protein [bacterium]